VEGRKKSPQEALKGYEGSQVSSLPKQDSFPSGIRGKREQSSYSIRAKICQL
jgi:hypothetical protein